MARLRLGLTTGVIGFGIAAAIIGGVGCSAILGDFTVEEFTTAATDGTSVIYGDMGNGIVAQIPVGGGNPILLANKGPAGGIAIGGGKVAFVPNGSSDLYLATIGQANSAVLSRASFDTGGNQAIAMDPSGAKQFIVNQDNPGVSYFIYFCNAVQCSTLANIKSASMPGQMAANATNLYWTDPGTSVVSTYSFPTTQMTTFASGQNKPNLVAIDSTYVYWVTGVPTIVRMKQAPGGALETVVALVPSAVEGLTTDGVNRHVFYAPVGGGGTPVPIYAQPGDFYDFTTAGEFVSWIGNNFIVYGARTPL